MTFGALDMRAEQCPVTIYLPADLLVNHVTHGHSDLHARSLDVVEVEMMEQRQADGADRQGSCVAEGLV